VLKIDENNVRWPPVSFSLIKTPTKTKHNSNWNPSARWPAPRASALDAARLDSELTSLLAEQAGRALAPFLRNNPGLAARFHPEITALLEGLVFARTIARGQPTPGLTLLGLRFVDERRSSAWWWWWRLLRGGGRRVGNNGDDDDDSESQNAHLPLSAGQRTCYGLATVALTYAWDRAARSGVLASLSEAPRGTRAHTAATVLRRTEAAVAVASLFNSVLFLAQRSRYRSLLEALLGAGLEPSDPMAPRTLSFDYLNRQLVWHELSELMLAILPLLDRRMLSRCARAMRALVGSSRVASSSTDSAGEAAADDPEAATTPSAPCGTCGAREPSTPFAAVPCMHPHCYYCLASVCASDPSHECWCGERVAAMVRLRGRR